MSKWVELSRVEQIEKNSIWIHSSNMMDGSCDAFVSLFFFLLNLAFFALLLISSNGSSESEKLSFFCACLKPPFGFLFPVLALRKRSVTLILCSWELKVAFFFTEINYIRLKSAFTLQLFYAQFCFWFPARTHWKVVCCDRCRNIPVLRSETYVQKSYFQVFYYPLSKGKTHSWRESFGWTPRGGHAIGQYAEMQDPGRVWHPSPCATLIIWPATRSTWEG